MKIIKSKYSSEELKTVVEKSEKVVETELLSKISKWRRIINGVLGALLMIPGIVLLVMNVDTRANEISTMGIVAIFMVSFSVPFIANTITGDILVSDTRESLIGRYYEKKRHILSNPLKDIQFFEKDHKFWFANGYSMLWRIAEMLEFCEKIWPAEELEKEEVRLQMLQHEDLLIVVEPEGPDELRIVDGIEISNWMEEAITKEVFDFSHFDSEIESCLKKVAHII